MRRMELLAPAGNREKLEMAVRYGADAVYLAGQSFGLRAFGGNFTKEELASAMTFVHDCGKKAYVTVNTIPRSAELTSLAEYLRYLYEIGTDAVLISDLGAFSLAREIVPNLPIHVSTQASTANWRAAKAWKDMGAQRVVLARELSLAEIGEISRRANVETEAFVHGAMCISWSGRCLLSNYFTGGLRDSNRGECIQACRFRYSVVEETRPGQYWPVAEDENGSYVFNSKDLCLIDRIPDLYRAGVSSLKIEGRMKSVYYAAAVVSVYRKALDAFYAEGEDFRVRPEWREELEKISHRPYTEGFAFHPAGADSQNYERSLPTQEYDFIGLVLSCDREAGTVLIEQRNHFRTGEEAECLCPDGRVFPVTIGALSDEEGSPVSAAPHPLEHVVMRTDAPLAPYAVLRRKIQHE